MIVKISEIDPICGMQACMDGYEVVSPYKDGNNNGTAECIDKQLLEKNDLIVTTTGNVNVCDRHMLAAVKRGAIVVTSVTSIMRSTLSLCVTTGDGKR